MLWVEESQVFSSTIEVLAFALYYYLKILSKWYLACVCKHFLVKGWGLAVTPTMELF